MPIPERFKEFNLPKEYGAAFATTILNEIATPNKQAFLSLLETLCRSMEVVIEYTHEGKPQRTKLQDFIKQNDHSLYILVAPTTTFFIRAGENKSWELKKGLELVADLQVHPNITYLPWVEEFTRTDIQRDRANIKAFMNLLDSIVP